MKYGIMLGILGLVGMTVAHGARPKIATVRCSNLTYTGMEWAGTCDDGVVPQDVTGRAICTAAEGAKINDMADGDVLENAATDDDENMSCWCQLTAPLVSPGIYVRSYTSALECRNWCASVCTTSLKIDAGMRTAMFSNMKRI